MVYANTVTNILNTWADIGVFAYILPFLMIFALVYGILSESKILGKNKAVHATIALAVGLLALQFDYVANFFATIFPYAGIGIAVLLVALILMGILTDGGDTSKWIFFGIGALIFIVVMLYTVWDFSWFGGYVGEDWVPWIILVVVIGGIITGIILGTKNKDDSGTTIHH